MSFPGVADQGDLIPFQRLVLIVAENRKREEEAKAHNSKNAAGPTQTNPLAAPNGGNLGPQKTRTIYTNTHELDDGSYINSNLND